jgi:NAD(P)H dehydrogenase (quinone)
MHFPDPLTPYTYFMIKVLVLYYSKNGSTRLLAEQIALGVESVAGCEAVLRTVPAVTSVVQALEPAVPLSGSAYCQLSDLEQCHALALGSPTRFGNMADAMKHFLDQTAPLWLRGVLIDKPACVFTSSTSAHGGQESTLLSMMLPLLHHGAMILGIPYSEGSLSSTQSGGSPYGATHHALNNTSALTTDEKNLAIAQGQRLARTAILLRAPR